MYKDFDPNLIQPIDPVNEARLLAEADRNLETLLQHQADSPLHRALRKHGFSRRDFVKWAAMMTATLGLPPSFTGRVARAAEAAPRLPVIWQELQSCTGNSEALLRSANPGVEDIILDLLSLEYSEVLMAAAGDQAEAVLEESIKKYKGQYIVVFEGSLPLAQDGIFLTIGHKGERGTELVKRIARDAKYVINAGTCAAYGGIPMAQPNPTGATGIKPFLRANNIHTPVINLPACPVSPTNIVGTILELVMFGRVPQLDAYDRPIWAYGTRIHDKCERRGNFDAGEFVQSWADLEGLKQGYCLYKVGCKGPFTYNNCGVVRYNQGTSWPIMAGHGCVGCAEPNFWDTMTPFYEPVANRVYAQPLVSDATADRVGVWALGAAAVGITAHAVGTMVRSALENRKSESMQKPKE
ncbi:hydrogenase small subunit [Meiothermus cerbereus]|uniref:hydrogenase small subunit n=1 Tax=Meiothermus cerbereus TaxID=65552 RepID=UPI003EEF31E8